MNKVMHSGKGKATYRHTDKRACLYSQSYITRKFQCPVAVGKDESLQQIQPCVEADFSQGRCSREITPITSTIYMETPLPSDTCEEFPHWGYSWES